MNSYQPVTLAEYDVSMSKTMQSDSCQFQRGIQIFLFDLENSGIGHGDTCFYYVVTLAYRYS